MGDVRSVSHFDDFLFLSTPRLRVGFYWKGGYALQNRLLEIEQEFLLFGRHSGH